MNLKNYLVAMLFAGTSAFAQVGVGTTTPAAALDVTSTNSGMLVPRVALTSTTDNITVQNPQGGPMVNGVLVFNTASAGAGVTAVSPGFYYWIGAPTNAWQRISTGATASAGWNLVGNAITNPATEFIGTTTNQDFRIRTNNADRFNVTSNGFLRSYSDGTAALPAYSWNAAAGENMGMFRSGASGLGFSTTGTERLRIPHANQVHAMSLGSNLLPFYSFQADPNTGMFSSGADALDFTTNGMAKFRIPNANQVHALSLGSNLLPFYSFQADPNTGMYSSGADQLDFTTNGTAKFRIPNANQVHGLFRGTAALPFYSFSADTRTGMYSPAADELAFSTLGAQRMRILSTGQVAVNTAAPNATSIFSAQASGAYTRAIYGFSGLNFGSGVLGEASGVNGAGIRGASSILQAFGVWGANSNIVGTGVAGAGNNQGPTYLTEGSGGAFTGIDVAIFGYTTDPFSPYSSGVIIQDEWDNQWDMGNWDGFGYYKIIGPGAVSTIVRDTNNEKVVMHATETPENLFEDYGIGKLVNGRVKIDIDPIFSKNIIVSEKHPLKVFIQLEGECNGVYVTNKSATSFEVVELKGGQSDTPFSYSIVATRGEEIHVASNGATRVARYDRRFEKAPKRAETQKMKTEPNANN